MGIIIIIVHLLSQHYDVKVLEASESQNQHQA